MLTLLNELSRQLTWRFWAHRFKLSISISHAFADFNQDIFTSIILQAILITRCKTKTHKRFQSEKLFSPVSWVCIESSTVSFALHGPYQIHTAAILSRETEKTLFYHPRPRSEKFGSVARQVRQSYFSLLRQNGCCVIKAHWTQFGPRYFCSVQRTKLYAEVFSRGAAHKSFLPTAFSEVNKTITLLLRWRACWANKQCETFSCFGIGMWNGIAFTFSEIKALLLEKRLLIKNWREKYWFKRNYVLVENLRGIFSYQERLFIVCTSLARGLLPAFLFEVLIGLNWKEHQKIA